MNQSRYEHDIFNFWELQNWNIFQNQNPETPRNFIGAWKPKEKLVNI